MSTVSLVTAVRFTIVLVMILGLGLFLTVPLEDLPETAFDESETQPLEGIPLFSTALLQAQARTPQPKLKLDARFRSDSTTEPHEPHVERVLPSSHPISDSITILDHSLRC